jgi:hypothetical protein
MTTRRKKLISLISLGATLTSLFLSSQASAYLAVHETAELIKPGYFRLGLTPQVYLANGGGTNVSAFLDIPIDSAINSQFSINNNKVDFWASASAK